MVAPVPAPKFDEVAAELKGVIQERVRYLDLQQDFSTRAFVRQIERKIDDLTRVDAALAWVLKAGLPLLAGNREDAEYALDNAARLGDQFNEPQWRIFVLLKLGYFSEAATVYQANCSVKSPVLSKVYPVGVVTASFQSMLDVMDAAKSAGIGIPAEFHELARDSAAVLAELQLSERDVRAMLDVAGEVLRKHELLTRLEDPLVRSVHGHGDPSLLFQLRLKAGVEEAMALTHEVLDLLIDRDLDRPGLAFSFIPLK